MFRLSACPAVSSWSIVLSMAFLAGSALPAQQSVGLIAPNTAGRLVLAAPAGWTTSSIALEDGHRPVLTLSDPETSVAASYSVFASHAEKPTAVACREEALTAMRARYKADVKLRQPQRAMQAGPDGTQLATASFVLASADESAPVGADQTEFLAFAAGTHACAELDLSLAPAAPFGNDVIAEPLKLLHFEAGYEPSADDLAAFGALFADQINDPIAATVYYQRALEVLPAGPARRDSRRRITDSLIDEMVTAQDLSGARQVASSAMATDPTYAMYSYDLACLDAEEHEPLGAETHLQEAFDHRTDVLPGESLPDPRLDASIQKLKSDRRFWSFVEHLEEPNESVLGKIKHLGR